MNKYMKLVAYLIQLIVLTSIFGGMGYIVARYLFNYTDEHVILLIFKGFEFLGIIIFAFLNKRIALVCIKNLRLNKKQLVLFLKYFFLSFLSLVAIVTFSKYLHIIRLRGIIELSYLKIALYFTLALAVAICEEIMFRGFIALYVNFRINKKTAIFLSSIIFALVHVQYDGFLPFVTALLAGIIFALLTFKYRSLFPSIAFHMGWNFSYFLFEHYFSVEMNIKFLGEIFEIPQIVLLSFIVIYLYPLYQPRLVR